MVAFELTAEHAGEIGGVLLQIVQQAEAIGGHDPVHKHEFHEGTHDEVVHDHRHRCDDGQRRDVAHKEVAGAHNEQRGNRTHDGCHAADVEHGHGNCASSSFEAAEDKLGCEFVYERRTIERAHEERQAEHERVEPMRVHEEVEPRVAQAVYRDHKGHHAADHQHLEQRRAVHMLGQWHRTAQAVHIGISVRRFVIAFSHAFHLLLCSQKLGDILENPKRRCFARIRFACVNVLLETGYVIRLVHS